MLYFSLSIKDMKLLVRLVRYINFQCHFVSEVAGDFRQSNRDNRRLPATNDSPECARLNATLKLQDALEEILTDKRNAFLNFCFRFDFG